MIDKKDLNFEYKQNLEDDIIKYLANEKDIDLRKAMNIYYKSQLSQQIAKGVFGIENMDYKYLAQDLMENEPELFA